MEEYYFLFGIGVIWTVFAVVQDLKYKEISNWLNFSLGAFALSYRGFYSLIQGDWSFFLLGVLGFALFFIVARILYYTWAFAGGDAKLLTSYGALLPFGDLREIMIGGLAFVFLLFLAGLVWTLVYSVKIVYDNKKEFTNEFKMRVRSYRYLLILVFIFSVSLVFLDFFYGVFAFIALSFIVLLFAYVKGLEKSMIILTSPKDLLEGDWLEKDVKVGAKVIKKSVHGLSKEDISILKRARRKVYVRQGIPFSPAFLISFLFMVFFFLSLGELPSFEFLF